LTFGKNSGIIIIENKKRGFVMISKQAYIDLIEKTAKAYSNCCLALEVLGLEGEYTDESIMGYFEDILDIAAKESNDYDYTKLFDSSNSIMVMDDCYWTPDMPLTIHFAWNLHFGDGGMSGEVTTIIIEGTKYKLSCAAEVYDCIMHLHQLRGHYGLIEETCYEGDAAYD
jgi:hypothetical protein